MAKSTTKHHSNPYIESTTVLSDKERHKINCKVNFSLHYIVLLHIHQTDVRHTTVGMKGTKVLTLGAGR